ncbi:MAG: FMN-binding protein [Gammaproteobacteria bacterium]|nr:FMN-binding protein [Gammaproteobacteria bacterium]
MMRYLLLFIISFACGHSYAKGVYQSNADFLNEVFKNDVPKTQMLWLLGDIKKGAAKILGEKPAQLRIRYWQKQQQTAWILEEVGKEKLITVGLLVENNQLHQIKVLAFRESRGWEVKESFFLEQFFQAQLTRELQLDRSIDGISGATLSVRTLKKLARLALFFHMKITAKDNV